MRQYHALAAAMMLAVMGIVSMASAESVNVYNQHLKLTIDPAAASFTLHRADGGAESVTLSRWTDQPVTLDLAAVNDPRFGKGQQATMKAADGSELRLTLFEKLPFAMVQDVIVNTTDSDQTIRQRVFAQLDCKGAAPVNKLRAFGTFAARAIESENNPGSYNHLALVEPMSRRGLVAVWLTHERGSGVMFYDGVDDQTVRLTARQDYGRLRLKPKQHEPSEKLLLGFFDDCRLGLEQYADAAAEYYGIDLPPQPTVYCTWYHAGSSNEKKLRAQTDFAAEHLKPFGFDVLQIDDGWQDGVKSNGPAKVFVRHRPGGAYPDGVKPIADYIKAKGMTPGLWYMPYAGTHDDPYFADKQEMFYHVDGKPLDVSWGGTCLDPSVPATQELIRQRTEMICGKWGYKYIKTDGLWMGLGTPHVYVNTTFKDDKIGDAPPADIDYTNVQAERTGLKIVRDTAGPDVFILGCNLAQNMRTLGLSIGFVDAMRIGPDNGPKWERMRSGTFSGSNLYFLHRRVWYNDPDPVYVRPQVPIEQARALVSWVALTGQLHASSYSFADLSAERLDILRRAMPAHTLMPRPVDLFEQGIPRMWLLTDDRRSEPLYVVGLFNWDEKSPVDLTLDTQHIGLPTADAYVGFDYWANAFVSLKAGQSLNVPPASCRIIALKPVSDHPQLISTSRHITQGVVDVKSDAWHAGKRMLHGESEVVGDDPYELRIARPAGGDWAIDRVEADGATIKVVGEEPAGWRVQLETKENQTVKWRVSFK
ncbi:hypothetical protein HED60_17530 [Planctomycetales bacterium ZRK34]|nr:hypothetical protein HED60_17530 [Planctomycetales bacterium ZRK34]